MAQKPSSLPPDLYDEAYYLHSLPGLEHAENAEVIDEALKQTIYFGGIKPEDRVLDFGCGRGTCVAGLAQYGCQAVGIDFSPAAIQFAQKYIQRFPQNIQKRVFFQCLKMENITFENEFDVIVFNQVFEHLHDWELEVLIQKFKTALKPGGRLVISTPNLNYERYFFPLKRIVELPFKFLKMFFRILRGKNKHDNFFKELFKIQYPISEHTKLHINLQTPSSIKRFMEKRGFSVKTQCVDLRKNIFNLILGRFWGQTIWLSCRASPS